MIQKYQITPVSKPRQTRRDKWLNPPRPAVARYRAYCDEIRWNKVQVPPDEAHVVFILPMPKSWTKKKKAEMDGRAHQSVERNDVDNLLKGFMDAVFPKGDSHIWDIRITKRWGVKGEIWIIT